MKSIGSFLDKEHTIAPPEFNRWLILSAALFIHRSIGQVYAYLMIREVATKYYHPGISKDSRTEA